MPHRSRWMDVLTTALLMVGAAVGSLTYFQDKESKSVALLTVALRGGGLRKCSGVAVGATAVLAAARCLDGADANKLVQVQLPEEAPPAASSKVRTKESKESKESKGSKMTFVAPAKKRRQKQASKEVPMDTRFSHHVLRGRGGGVALLRLTAPLEGAWRRTAPLAAEAPPLTGSSHCRLLSWGLTSSFPPEARLARWAARAGNWSACWRRAGAGGAGGADGAAEGRVCAQAEGCLDAGTGAALLCQGALVALAPPPERAPSASQDPCGGGALLLHAVVGLQDWLQKNVLDLTTAPSGLRSARATRTATTTRAMTAAAAAAAAAAATRRRSRRRGKRHSRP